MLTVSLAMLTVHVTSAIRCALNLICGLLEWRVVLPRVWPDKGLSGAAPWVVQLSHMDENADTSAQDRAEIATLALLHARQPSPDELRQLDDIRPPVPVTLTQTEDDRHMNIMTQATKSRAVLGDIPAMAKVPLPPLPSEIHSQRVASRRIISAGQVSPIHRLLTGEGPLPPALLAQQRLQYELL